MQSNTHNKTVVSADCAAMSETTIYKNIAFYMKTCWPDVLYRFDFAAGTKLSKKQAVEHKNLQKDRGFCDFVIFKKIDVADKLQYCGLALEIKKSGERIYKVSGEFANEHIREQAKCLEVLKSEGWMAHFAIGLNECIDRIENYLLMSNAKKHASVKF